MLFFVILVGACVAIGIPIAFSFGVGTLSYLAITTTVPLNTVVGRMNEGISNLVLLAVPLYWAWPHAQTLLVLQACLLAAAAVPVYLLRQELRKDV